jgi:hypothetical protein
VEFVGPPSTAMPAGGKSPFFLGSANWWESLSSLDPTRQYEIVIVVVHTASLLSWNLDVEPK